MNRRAFVGALAAAGAGSLLPPRAAAELRQGRTTRAVVDELRRSLPALMEEARIPGASVAVLSGGRAAWSGGFGVRSAGGADPVTEHTPFEAASLSKPVFAYAVLGLCQQGALSLDAPLATILPDYAADPGIARITARNVLAHNSGLPNWRRGRPLTVAFEPGARYAYSGEGYFYLQRVVERLVGEPLDPWIRRRLLDPLGMRASSFVWRPQYERAAAAGHDREARPVARLDERLAAGRAAGNADPEVATPAMNGASSLYTTAHDYALFVEEFMRTRGGASHQLSAAWRAAMLTPHTRVSASLSRGLGWGLERTDAGAAFFHGGNNFFVRNIVLGSIDSRAAVVVFTNSQNGPRLFEPAVTAAVGGVHPAIASA